MTELLIPNTTGVYVLKDLVAETAFARVFLARSAVEGKHRDLFIYLLTPGVSLADRQFFQAQVARTRLLGEHFAAYDLAAGYAEVIEAEEEPIPLIVVDRPVAAPLPEQIAIAGPFTEMDGMRFARRLLALIDVIHQDLDCVLNPSVFTEMRWESVAQRLWWPVWLGFEQAPSVERKAEDLRMAGEMLHFALLGQEPRRLWGESLALPAEHARWSQLGVGAQQLLRGLLHPQREERIGQVKAALTAIQIILDAWEHTEPKMLLASVEAMLEKGNNGDVALAEQAFIILDVLERRGQEQDWMFFDSLQEEARTLYFRHKEVTSALNLLRGGSREAALEQLQQAVKKSNNSLPLLRWRAVAADVAIVDLLQGEESMEKLRRVIAALESGNLQSAQALAIVLTSLPQALAVELKVLSAWQSATEAAETAQALAFLDQAVRQLVDITDDDFRLALDFSLGGLNVWRTRAAAYNLAEERSHQQTLLYEAARSARLAGELQRAVASFEIAVIQTPAAEMARGEAWKLGLACLQAQEPFLARRVFARALAEQVVAADDLLLGWRTAQAQILLSNSPSSQAALEATQTAVAALVAARADQRQDDFAPALMGVLEMAVISALQRVRATQTPSSQAAASQLAQEWSRLNASMHLPREENETFQKLETALHLAWAQNPDATRGLVAKWLELLSLSWPSVGTVQAFGSSSTNVGQDPEAMRKLTVGLAQKARSVLGTNAGPRSGQAGNTQTLTNDQIAAGLVSSHFDEVEKALNDWSRLPGTEKERMASMAAAAQTSLQNHKVAMTQVADQAEEGKKEAAYKALRMGTRQGESRTAWDSYKQTWTSTKEWLALLESNGLDRFRFDLAGPDPFFWARTIQFYVQNRPQWPPELLELAQRRWTELDRHRQTMEQIFSMMKKQPAGALERLEVEVGDTPDIHCWNPERRAWVTAQALRGEIETRLALPEIRNRI